MYVTYLNNFLCKEYQVVCNSRYSCRRLNSFHILRCSWLSNCQDNNFHCTVVECCDSCLHIQSRLAFQSKCISFGKLVSICHLSRFRCRVLPSLDTLDQVSIANVQAGILLINKSIIKVSARNILENANEFTVKLTLNTKIEIMIEVIACLSVRCYFTYQCSCHPPSILSG